MSGKKLEEIYKFTSDFIKVQIKILEKFPLDKTLKEKKFIALHLLRNK